MSREGRAIGAGIGAFLAFGAGHSLHNMYELDAKVEQAREIALLEGRKLAEYNPDVSKGVDGLFAVGLFGGGVGAIVYNLIGYGRKEDE